MNRREPRVERYTGLQEAIDDADFHFYLDFDQSPTANKLGLYCELVDPEVSVYPSRISQRHCGRDLKAWFPLYDVADVQPARFAYVVLRGRAILFWMVAFPTNFFFNVYDQFGRPRDGLDGNPRLRKVLAILPDGCACTSVDSGPHPALPTHDLEIQAEFTDYGFERGRVEGRSGFLVGCFKMWHFLVNEDGPVLGPRHQIDWEDWEEDGDLPAFLSGLALEAPATDVVPLAASPVAVPVLGLQEEEGADGTLAFAVPVVEALDSDGNGDNGNGDNASDD